MNFVELSGELIEICKNVLKHSRMFVECSKNVLEISMSFFDIPTSGVDMLKHLLEIYRKALGDS